MKKLKIFIIVFVVLLLQVALCYSMISRFLTPKASVQEEEKQDEAAEEDSGEIYIFKDVIVNPADTGGRRYLVVSMGLELDEKKLAGEIEKKEPQIRDAIITLLSQKNVPYLVDIQKKDSLRHEILEIINGNLSQGQVAKIYFVKYILQ